MPPERGSRRACTALLATFEAAQRLSALYKANTMPTPQSPLAFRKSLIVGSGGRGLLTITHRDRSRPGSREPKRSAAGAPHAAERVITSPPHFPLTRVSGGCNQQG